MNTKFASDVCSRRLVANSRQPAIWSCLRSRVLQVCACSILLLPGMNTASAAELTAANYAKTDNGAEMSFTVEGLNSDPFVFATEEPPRLVLEFSQTTSDLPASPNVINEQLVRSYTTISDGARTRVIVELQDPVEYRLSVVDEQVQMQLVSAQDDEDSSSAVATAAPATPASRQSPKAVPVSHQYRLLGGPGAGQRAQHGAHGRHRFPSHSQWRWSHRVHAVIC